MSTSPQTSPTNPPVANSGTPDMSQYYSQLQQQQPGLYQQYGQPGQQIYYTYTTADGQQFFVPYYGQQVFYVPEDEDKKKKKNCGCC